VLKKKAQPNLTQAELAKLFGIKKKNTVSTILKRSSDRLTLDESLTLAKRKRERTAAILN
jgi:antitoxin component HigA of HigAB toxin-antitoxin module